MLRKLNMLVNELSGSFDLPMMKSIQSSLCREPVLNVEERSEGSVVLIWIS
jgi:hypothetical protein